MAENTEDAGLNTTEQVVENTEGTGLNTTNWVVENTEGTGSNTTNWIVENIEGIGLNTTNQVVESTGLNTTDRVASVEDVEKAVALLRIRALKSKKFSKRKSSEETREKMLYGQCLMNFTSFTKKSTASLAFAQNHSIVEMRNALIHEDWSTMQKIFPLILKCLHTHQIAWRHAFLIYLLCPYVDLSCFQEFFKMTIGERFVDNGFYLENLMTLHEKIKQDDS